jgi:hypothetical protein
MTPQKIKQAAVWVGTVLAWSALGLFIILIGIALFTRHAEPSPQLTASAGSAAVYQTASSTPEDLTGGGGGLYFVSGKSYGNACPADKNIDWQVAADALSDYMNASSTTDFGPAEIERHFEYNCAADMEIYNNFVRIEATLTALDRSFKCPNDYASPQEYVNAAAKFVHDINQILPNSASADVLAYRQQLLESHKCEPSKWL